MESHERRFPVPVEPGDLHRREVDSGELIVAIKAQ
jgi:hypothetical protein